MSKRLPGYRRTCESCGKRRKCVKFAWPRVWTCFQCFKVVEEKSRELAKQLAHSDWALGVNKERVKWLEDRVAWLERENKQYAEMTQKVTKDE